MFRGVEDENDVPPSSTVDTDSSETLFANSKVAFNAEAILLLQRSATLCFWSPKKSSRYEYGSQWGSWFHASGNSSFFMYWCDFILFFFFSTFKRWMGCLVALPLYPSDMLMRWNRRKKKHLYTAKPVFVCVYIVHIVTVLSDCGWWYFLPKDCNKTHTINIGNGRL